MFLILLMPLLGVMFALVWEGGQMLVAKAELMTVAHSAARAGTHQVDQTATLDAGTPVLDEEHARRAAVEYLDSAGVRGGAVAEEGRVVVVARAVYSPVLLPIAESEIEAQASATAHQS
ncbi:pilus assembly protein TadG-related protein [Nocardiopsis metallicus]|uniref:pilus assembly protein TadG-related protein n=1 Tax=Nocardiopsis metallicus TaxID=179819 RepID=UPI0016154FCB